MARYAVGDLQGCLEPLLQLLKWVQFNPSQDQLWLAGDLVNRGPASEACLDYVMALGSSARVVLGNHDLHLLARLEGLGKARKQDTLDGIVNSPKARVYQEWLVQQPLAQSSSDYWMSHAGLPPCWSTIQAQALAQEVSQCLQEPSERRAFLQHMYGNEPNPWQPDLTGVERLRCITNYLTRMRFCDGNSRLDFDHKEAIDQPPIGMKPWFEWPCQPRQQRLIFGHWAALMGQTRDPDCLGLDTGCVWQGYLSLLNLDTLERFGCTLLGRPWPLAARDF